MHRVRLNDRTIWGALSVCLLVVSAARAQPSEESPAPLGHFAEQPVWFHSGQQWVPLYPAPDVVDVILKPEYEHAPPAVLLQHAIDIDGRHYVARIPSGAAAVDYRSLIEVEAVQDVYYASALERSLHTRAGRYSASRRIAVRVVEPSLIEAVLSDYDLAASRRPEYGVDSNTIIVTVQEEPGAIEESLELLGDRRVLAAVPLFHRPLDLRGIPNDTYFGNQWHLFNTGQGGGAEGEDINIVDAWDLTRGGGVVGVIDDGMQTNHPDLAANIDLSLSYDYAYGDPDPWPSCFDGHGTGVGGIVAALQNNNLGVSGVAPGARLAAIRLLVGPITDEQIADALSHRLDSIHVFNNSWGPLDNARVIEGPGILSAAAIEYGIQTGRNGLGAIYVWAGGNGGALGDNANFDGYVNSRYTIGVAATDNFGRRSPFSEPGACILVNAPSAGGTRGIVTTDLTGACGADPGDYNFGMWGTSTSAPIVAGVVALMLDVNPALTWRDVQDILVRSARKNDPNDPGWRLNAGGLHVHDYYGFGRVDAIEAVATAASWSAVFPDSLPVVAFDGPVVSQTVQIPDNNAAGVSLSQAVAPRFSAQHVEVEVSIAHGRRGDLELTLISPSGTTSKLATPRPNDTAADLNWTFSSVQFWGEPTAGEWRLVVRDLRSGLAGRVERWSLRIHGRHLNLPRGDMNGDGVRNSHDIDPFVTAIATPLSYGQLYPGLNANYLGDFDGNGVLTVMDLSGFALSMSR